MLAAVTCFFNPMKYRRPVENWHRFRRALRDDVPLYSIELSFDGEFQTDSTWQVRGTIEKHLMWQKERLLNLAIERVPDKYDKIAWLDSDILFLNDKWVEEADKLLDDKPLVQLYDSITTLDGRFRPENRVCGFVWGLANGSPDYWAAPGGAWAARREISPLLDDAILGGGDTLMVGAWMGWWRNPGSAVMNQSWYQEYFKWGLQQHRKVQGNVGHVSGSVFHFWHGSRANRRYTERQEYLALCDYQPSSDIKLDCNGLWTWASDKAEMQALVRHYFRGRREDRAESRASQGHQTADSCRRHLPRPNAGPVDEATVPGLPGPGPRSIHACDVVIPYTEDNIRWLAQSVESILNQNYADCTIHLICDGPPILDDPAQRLCSRSSRVRWYRNKQNIGPYRSVHRVWDYLETDFVALQDSDDIALPNRIWYSVETIEKTGADMLSAVMEQFVSHEAPSDWVLEYLGKLPFHTPGRVSKFSPEGSVVNSTMICRREAFERMNGFLPLKCSADLEYPTRARRLGLKILNVPHVLALRRLHRTSLSNGDEWGPHTKQRKRTWAYIQTCCDQYDKPGVDYARFGSLSRDRKSPDTLRLSPAKVTFQNLEYHVTHACNMRCRSCTHFSNYGHQGHASPEQAEREFSLWSHRLRPKWFSLLGGEPTLNPDLCKIIRIAARHWRESLLQLVTNGWFLHRHPDLPAVLEETGCRLEVSIHGNDSSYRARVEKIRALCEDWESRHTMFINWRESYTKWRETYRDTGAGVEPFDDGDPDASWQTCKAKWCPQLHGGQLHKCPQIAYLSMQLEKSVPTASDEWDHYLRYKPLRPECSQDEAERFLRRQGEWICGMCPVKPMKIPCDKIGALGANRVHCHEG
ncbi:MAG TPA: glycosyltransferase [Thermoguttaceae bacterium]|nr:glycosyltransferase [Thermoguttaceae bacterium]